MHSTLEKAVRERYADASRAREDALCCPVNYEPRYLEVIPDEVIERDYGCGDPSKYLREGETVLDLGSGAGKICFIASQVVGRSGRVIGVDMTDDMLELAGKAAETVAGRIGYSNVEFRKGRIQDLALDWGRADRWLRENPIRGEADYAAFEHWKEIERRERPMVPDASVDVVVSNCVLNLVSDREKKTLFRELHRVLRKGGRAVISDIVSDEPVPEALKRDPELWSGCLSGAFQEGGFLRAFEDAGFYGIRLLSRDEKPWRTVDGIEFRSVTVEAFKGKEGDCWEHHEAVIYKGPFRSVTDDDGHTFERGERIAVCRKTYGILTSGPYAGQFEGVKPLREIPEGEAEPFACTAGSRRRRPAETKGEDYHATTRAPEGGCC